ncbi:MAG: hypothetical protein OHK0039_18630 [Bacteroidia bacterium]
MHRAKLYFLFWSFGCLGIGHTAAQTASLDSLRSLLKLPTADSVAVRQALADSFADRRQWDSVVRYDTEILRYAQQRDDSALLIATLFGLVETCRMTGDTATADSFDRMHLHYQAHYGYVMRSVHVDYFNAYRQTRIQRSILVLPDSSGTMPFDSALAAYARGDFLLPDQRPTNDSVAYWVRLRIREERDSAEHSLWMVGMDNASWDTVDIYLRGPGGWIRQRTGMKLRPEDKTAIQDWRNLFTIDIPVGADATVFLRLRGLSTPRKPSVIFLNHMRADHLTRVEAEVMRNSGIFLGILLVQGLCFCCCFLPPASATTCPTSSICWG